MGYWNGCLFGGGFLMMFLGILVVVGIVYLLVKGFNNNNNNNNNVVSKTTQAQNSDALEIAKIRLAKGEISAEEFKNIKKNLQ